MQMFLIAIQLADTLNQQKIVICLNIAIAEVLSTYNSCKLSSEERVGYDAVVAKCEECCLQKYFCCFHSKREKPLISV